MNKSKLGARLSRGRIRSAHGPRIAGGLLFVLVAVIGVTAPASVDAQVNGNAVTAANTTPRVFLDCQGPVPCDRNHFRTEIQWVNWMNDREDADVHLIITSESVGGGGRRFNLDFIGREAMAHLTDALTYTSSGTDVQIETVDGITQAMGLGLMRYAVEAGMGREIALNFNPSVPQNTQNTVAGGVDEASSDEAAVPVDPWNYWTFRTGFNGNMSIQELQSSYRVNTNFGADRVTDSWKINLGGMLNVNRDKRTLSDRVVRNDREGWNVNTLIVRSINENMSAGASLGGGSSSQNNRTARITLTPAIEWNYYPYAEANRRQLIAHYSAGVQYNSYETETVFGVMQETVPLHRLGIQYRAVEGWGNAGVSLDASQYLHASGLYSIEASGNVSFRLLRGLELSLSASGGLIEDQIHVSASTLSEEDILLGRTTLPTSYSYQGSIGFNYRWGSSFSNIVNTRFPNSVR